MQKNNNNNERANGRRDGCQHKRGRGSMNPPPIVPCSTVAVCQVWLRVRLRDVLQNLLHVLVVAIARCQQAKILPVRAQFNLFGYVISYRNNKYFQRVNATAIRVFWKWIHSTIGWRRDEHETHKYSHGSWIICSVSRVCSKTMHSLFSMTSWKLP